MAIKGSLKEASLPDVIQLLFLGRRTGCLAVADRQSHGSVYLEDGWITHATIVNRRDRFGDILVKRGRISQAQLDEGIRAQAGMPDRKLGEILASLGFISRDELVRWARIQVEEAVYTLFTWQSGSFTFEAGVRPDDVELGDPINPESLLLEGARRVDEWALIERKIPSFDLIFSLEHEPDGSLEFTETQRRILPLLDGARDVRALIEDAGLSEFDVGQALYGLLTAGLVRRVGTSTPAPTTRQQETNIEEHRNLGVAFYRTGMLDEAVREFRRVAELRPSEGAAPFYLGLIALRQHRYEDAADHFRQSIDRAGPRPSALHNLGLALEYGGRLEQAEPVLADAAVRGRDDPRILLSWGSVALARGDVEAADARLRQARDRFGGAPPAPWFEAMSRAAAARGELDRALTVAREGVEAYPGATVLRNNLAVFLEAAGEVEQAEALLRAALEEEPGIPQIAKNLGDLCYRSGRFDEAWEHYERAAKLVPDLGDDLYFKMGNLALKRRETERAGDLWRRAVELNPDHQLARANLDALGTG